MLDQSYLLRAVANWKSPVREILEYKTEIITTRAGWEQRRALRQTPRCALEYEIFATPLRSGQFNTMLATRPGESMLIPHPAQFAKVDRRDSNFVTWFWLTNDKPDWIKNGAKIVFANPAATEWELVQATLNHVSNLFMTTAAPALSWGKGARAFRVLSGRMAESPKYSADIKTLLAGKQRFELDVGQDLYPDRAAFSAALGGPGELIDGRELFPFTVDWASAVQVETDFYRESVDFGFGPREFILPRTENQRIYQFVLTAMNRFEAESIIAFFMRQLGQCRAFWMVSPLSDLVPLSGLTGGNSDLKIEGRNFLRPYDQNRSGSYEPDAVFSKLVVKTTFGLELRRNVVSFYGADAWETDGQWRNTLLTVDEAWPYDIPLSMIESVAWITKARFATDALTIDWQNQDMARFNVSIRTIRE